MPFSFVNLLFVIGISFMKPVIGCLLHALEELFTEVDPCWLPVEFSELDGFKAFII